MTYVDDHHYKIQDAGHAGWIYGPGYLYFRMNERDGACLKNNYSGLDVEMYAWFIK